MKKAVKRSITIVGAILAVILAVVLILLFIKPAPLSSLESYDRIRIYNLGTTNNAITLDGSDSDVDDYLDTFDKGLKKSKYSVLHGILEGKASTALKFNKHEEVDPDDEDKTIDVKDVYTSSDITSSKFAPTGEKYKVEFFYNSVKSVIVEGEAVRFNRAVILVGDSSNEIADLEVVFYDETRMNNQIETDEDYEIYSVRARIIATNLYNAIADIFDTFGK